MFLMLLVSGILFVWWSNYKIESETEQLVTSDISKVPAKKVGLLLGTGKTLQNGMKNLYFLLQNNYTNID